jgi:N-acetylglucosamine malate deacetylase 2
MKSPGERVTQEEVLHRLLANPVDPHLKVAVLAAHPDDETIGASVLLARCPDAAVIYLTDGAPKDSKLWCAEFCGSREEYTSLRRNEAERALSFAGLTTQQMHWLGAIDQEAIFSATDLAARLAAILTTTHADVLITHAYEGGHPDHDSASLVARLALEQLIGDGNPVHVEMTSYHARAGQCVTGEFLHTRIQSDVPSEEICVELSAADRVRKRQMFAVYASQRLVLNSFGTDYERFRLAPEYNFSRAPHEGKLWYECMGWPITGERWRALAVECIAHLQETACH